MSAVTHFEIYATEPGKLADFYRTLFGWQLDKAPGIDYWRIQTEPNHTNGFNGPSPSRAVGCTTSTLIPWMRQLTKCCNWVERYCVRKRQFRRPPGTQFSQTRRETSLPSGRLTRLRFHHQSRRSDGHIRWAQKQAAAAKHTT
jgi:hypothetical protein